MDIRAFSALGIIQQAIYNQVNNANTSTTKPAQNSENPRTKRSIPDTLQSPHLTGPDSATRPTVATGRPAGDHRTAEEIINANPVLKNLDFQPSIYRHGPRQQSLPHNYREGIYKHTGDWTENNKDPESRANSAFNAAQVLNFIDSSEAHAVLTSQHNDGFLTGRLPGSRTQEHSEYALLATFIEKGYSGLVYRGEQQVLHTPTYATGRPLNDKRSAEQLINDNKQTFEKIEIFFKKMTSTDAQMTLQR